MKIGVIGAGHIGSVLAKQFRSAGHTVVIANSRGPETLSDLARATGATAVYIQEAADGVDCMVVTIPMKNVPSLPRNLLARLPAGSPVIDTGNYYPLRDGSITEIDDGMVESEWTSRILRHPVIKAFNNITAYSLANNKRLKGSYDRIALPVSGDDVRSKQVVLNLVDQIGFDPYDAGTLAESWRYQPGTPAYCPDPTLKQLPKLLQKANRAKAPKNRDQAAKMMAKVPNIPPAELVRLARLSAGLDTLKPRTWLAVLRLGFAMLGAPGR
ncbi:putative dinucleotide-binding enzyme [Acidisarcina polymorpha]|uniref:Putative dinucleotide-binding enzyme n=1 Tax=Acidisarcina polymorpha TaxID=2211140 RepID=A0A2Z5G4R7_9BACT|nr:NAD(P)-binding domain-containing protein [Acidisarcina polymorpha]AXC14088.1 putative dinucleotide-binding enzyme [Acidisarcina polymorpha]